LCDCVNLPIIHRRGIYLLLARSPPACDVIDSTSWPDYKPLGVRSVVSTLRETRKGRKKERKGRKKSNEKDKVKVKLSL
jgi:hypothetical protein